MNTITDLPTRPMDAGLLQPGMVIAAGGQYVDAYLGPVIPDRDLLVVTSAPYPPFQNHVRVETMSGPDLDRQSTLIVPDLPIAVRVEENVRTDQLAEEDLLRIPVNTVCGPMAMWVDADVVEAQRAGAGDTWTRAYRDPQRPQRG